MPKSLKTSILILSVVIVVSFFLPWITVESPALGGISKVLTGKRQARIDSISGFRIPIMANSSESRFMLSIIQIFDPGIKDAHKKSFLIWGIPVLAILISILIRRFGRNVWINLGIGVFGVLIFFAAVYKIVTTDLDKLVLKVNIAYGLWMILFSYLGIGLFSLLSLLKTFERKTH